MYATKLAVTVIYAILFIRTFSYGLYGIKTEKKGIFLVTLICLAVGTALLIKYLQNSL